MTSTRITTQQPISGMELTNNAKATIVFAAVLAVLGVYDMASRMAHPAWGATRPDFLKDAGPFVGGVILPLSLLILAVAVAVVYVLPNIPAGIYRIDAGFPYAAAICAFVIIVGALLGWYAWQGRREVATS